MAKKIKIVLDKEFSDRLKQAKLEAKTKMEKAIREIPPIHWEILKYSNDHSKEETIEKYPDHIDFINTIIKHERDTM
jgi:hypothetical protein